MNATVGDVWYRYDDVQYAASVNEFDEPVGEGRLMISLRELRVSKVTKKGVWLDGVRFVLASATKRYACPDKTAAWESFRRRKLKESSIYRARLNRAERALSMVQP